MNELPHTIRAIFNQLSEDSGVTDLVENRIYYGMAGEGSEYPCVVFSHVAGTEGILADGTRFNTRPIFLIKAVSEGHSALLAARIANAVDKAIEPINREETVDDDVVRIEGCIRQEPASMTERNRDSGVTYQHIGAYYQFFVWVP